MAFFSVIVPVYNKAEFIADTLRSALTQTFSDFELIIVNDGSTDRSEYEILKFSDLRIRYFSRENSGVASARNFGLFEAASDHIAFLDADDIWFPDFLATMHGNIRKFPEQKVFAAAFEIGTARTTFPAAYSLKSNDQVQVVDFFEASRKESVLWTSSSVYHRSVFQKAGVFDEKVAVAEDTDLWIRVGLSYPVVFDQRVLARYVYDAASHSRHKSHGFEDHFFQKYKEIAADHSGLKKFLDLNIFSAMIKSRLAGDSASFEKFRHEIDLKNLSLKKKLLLKLPAYFLKKLVSLKSALANMGIGNSVFK